VSRDLLALAIALVLAAAAQDLLPGLPGTPLKLPFLTGIAAYYALNRPVPVALLAALAAGCLTDGAGGLPGGCTSVFLLLAGLGLRPLKRFLLDGSPAGVSVACAGLALLQAVWQTAWVRLALPGGAWQVVGGYALLLPSGAIAGAAAGFGAGLLDRWDGNVRPREEIRERGC